jgi:hypothetical protein
MTNGVRWQPGPLSRGNVTAFIESQAREQKYGMEHIAIDTDELDTLVDKLKAQGIHILEQTTWRMIAVRGPLVARETGPRAPCYKDAPPYDTACCP